MIKLRIEIDNNFYFFFAKIQKKFGQVFFFLFFGQKNQKNCDIFIMPINAGNA